MRLVDLHCDWLRQYATETTLYERALYPEIPGRVGRLDGYLLGTSLAVLACARKPEDWARQADVWGSLGLMIARHEAEFAGRILRDAGDVARWWSSSPDGLCWGVLGVVGFDALVRTAGDLDRLPALFERGVRVFRPIDASGGVLGGAAGTGDDRGLTDLGRAFLERLAGLSPEAGPRPILDLAGMGTAIMADTLRWYREREATPCRPLLMASRATGRHDLPFDDPGPEAGNLRDLRSLGGIIGLTPGRPGCETPDELKVRIETLAAIPFEGRTGYEGIAIASDLLGVERTASGLASAREILRWLRSAFDRETAEAIAFLNARRLLLRSVGAEPEAGGPGA